jgi:hypothetical protein
MTIDGFMRDVQSATARKSVQLIARLLPGKLRASGLIIGQIGAWRR